MKTQKEIFDPIYNRIVDFRISEMKKILSEYDNKKDKDIALIAVASCFTSQARLIYETIGDKEFAAKQFYRVADSLVK